MASVRLQRVEPPALPTTKLKSHPRVEEEPLEDEQADDGCRYSCRKALLGRYTRPPHTRYSPQVLPERSLIRPSLSGSRSAAHSRARRQKLKSHPRVEEEPLEDEQADDGCRYSCRKALLGPAIARKCCRRDRSSGHL
jgi:hypothetical protein